MSYEGKRVVVVCPAGRRRYTRLLAAHLEAQEPAGLIDEVQWWVNTFDLEDARWLEALRAANPSFHRLVRMERPGVAPLEGKGKYRIGAFLPYAVAPETIYVRFDDDIVWMAPTCVARLCGGRACRRDALLIYANIVNNPVCDALRAFACAPGAVAHDLFLRDHAEGTAPRRWLLQDRVLGARPTVPINAISWFGEDLAPYAEFSGREEPYLATELPERLGRKHFLCGSALCVHFAYGPQRSYLDRLGILRGYETLAPGNALAYQ